jgi:hypothetical protein
MNGSDVKLGSNWFVLRRGEVTVGALRVGHDASTGRTHELRAYGSEYPVGDKPGLIHGTLTLSMLSNEDEYDRVLAALGQVSITRIDYDTRHWPKHRGPPTGFPVQTKELNPGWTEVLTINNNLLALVHRLENDASVENWYVNSVNAPNYANGAFRVMHGTTEKNAFGRYNELVNVASFRHTVSSLSGAPSDAVGSYYSMKVGATLETALLVGVVYVSADSMAEKWWLSQSYSDSLPGGPNTNYVNQYFTAIADLATAQKQVADNKLTIAFKHGITAL